MKRTAIALGLLALVTAGIARVATADDQGSTLITVQWDSGVTDGGAAPTPTPTPVTVPVAVAVADAGAAPVAVADAGADAAPEPQGQSKYRGDINSYYRYFGLDLDVSGGGGYHWGERGIGRPVGFGKIRGGLMYATWPFVYSIGATFESNNLSPAAWGLQAEVTHIGAGIWLQVGGMIDWKAQGAFTAALGWSVFGIEAQLRGYQDALPEPTQYFGYGISILGKVRVPIGFILYVLSRK